MSKRARIKEEKDDGFAVLEFSQQESKKKRRIRSLLLLLFNVLVIAVIIIVEVVNNKETEPIGNVLKVWGDNWIYLLALLGILLVNIFALSFRFSAVIYAMTGRKRFKLSFSTAVLGKYYDNVTPFGTGGQPFQMFNLGRKLDVGLATSIPIANYLVHEFVSVIIQIVIFCTTYHVMDNYDFYEWAAYVGLVLFAFVPISILLFSIFPKTITKIARFICRVGHKLHIVKDIDKTLEKVISGVQRYSDTLKLICKKWRTLIVMIILSAVYNIGFNSIPFFVLKACGIDADFVTTLSLSYYVFSAITIVPTPGGAGAAEGVTYAIFSPLNGQGLPFRFWGILLWRFCVYYSTLLIGFSVTIYQYVHAARKERRQNRLRTQTESGETVVALNDPAQEVEGGGELEPSQGEVEPAQEELEPSQGEVEPAQEELEPSQEVESDISGGET